MRAEEADCFYFYKSQIVKNLGFIDVSRIEHICTFNSFGIELFGKGQSNVSNKMLTDVLIKCGAKSDDGTGLFIQASLFNHSCLGFFFINRVVS